MKVFSIHNMAPFLIIAYIAIAFTNWNYQTGTRGPDGNIYPISSFSMYNRAVDVKMRLKLKNIQKEVRERE
jgi:hypothetical protein